jgi:hypothetical protein
MLRRLFFSTVTRAVPVIELPQEDPVMARLAALESKVTSLQSAVANMAQKATANGETQATEGQQLADVLAVVDGGAPNVAEAVPVVVESGTPQAVPVVVESGTPHVAEAVPVVLSEPVHAKIPDAAPGDSV